VLAFDGSYNRDSTALIGATIEEHPYVWVEARVGTPANEPDWRTPRNEVMAAIEDALARYDVREFAPDPPGWHREIEELEAMYGEIVVRFETSQPRRMGPAATTSSRPCSGRASPTNRRSTTTTSPSRSRPTSATTDPTF
jgi:hypothetical protein